MNLGCNGGIITGRLLKTSFFEALWSVDHIIIVIIIIITSIIVVTIIETCSLVRILTSQAYV